MGDLGWKTTIFGNSHTWLKINVFRLLSIEPNPKGDGTGRLEVGKPSRWWRVGPPQRGRPKVQRFHDIYGKVRFVARVFFWGKIFEVAWGFCWVVFENIKKTGWRRSTIGDISQAPLGGFGFVEPRSCDSVIFSHHILGWDLWNRNSQCQCFWINRNLEYGQGTSILTWMINWFKIDQMKERQNLSNSIIFIGIPSLIFVPSLPLSFGQSGF